MPPNHHSCALTCAQLVVASLARFGGQSCRRELAWLGRSGGTVRRCGTLAAVTTCSGGYTQVLVFDTATGAQIGSTVSIAGMATTPALIGADDSHVVTGEAAVGYTTTSTVLLVS